jgi:hypothetical protein
MGRPRTITALLLHVMAAVLACAVGNAAPVFSGMARGPAVESGHVTTHHVALRRSPSIDRGAAAARTDGGHEPDALASVAILPRGADGVARALAYAGSAIPSGHDRPHASAFTAQLGARGPPRSRS